MTPARRAPSPLFARAALVACLLLTQFALHHHEMEFSVHGKGDLCLLCLAGADLNHGEVSTAVFFAPPVVPIFTAIRHAWSYLPVISTPFHSRGPPRIAD